VVLIEWAWRERGLIVAPDNPLGLRTIGDLAGRSVMPRQAEAASQQLLLHLLAENGLRPDDISFLRPPARNETDLALAVADGKADAVFGLAGAARPYRLDFVPLLRERYDLLVWRRFYFEAPFQRLVGFCRGNAFAARAAEFGGYDVSGLGAVHFNGA
jgi:molybdate-binding protein